MQGIFHTKTNPKNKKHTIVNYFVDMDGVLAVYEDDIHLHMNKPGYFLSRPLYPHSRNFFLNLWKRSLLKDNSDSYSYRLYILSKLPIGESTAYKDKLSWLEKNFPEIPKSDIYLLPAEYKKGDFIKENFPEDSKSTCYLNILFDDYTDNLINWESQDKRFIGIKVLNGNNSKEGRWKQMGKKTISLENFDIFNKIEL